MNSKHTLIAALLAGAFSSVSAAPQRGDGADAANAGVPVRAGQDAYGGALVQMHGKVVKNAPYSAEVISEQQQNLADGNQIVTRSTSMSYRDSAGRTRQELRDASGNVRTVTISDPVEGTTFILNPQQKSATRIGPRAELASMVRQEVRKELREESRADDGERVIVKRIERPLDNEARQKLREEVRIRIGPNVPGNAAMAGVERIGPMVAGAVGDMKWAATATIKDLGTKEIDGIKAQGKLKTYEIPAGEVGNRNPIVVSAENWYAPQLHVTLMTRRSDPRTGERTWRMANIKRDEPAAALFAVPADYAIKDAIAQVKKNENR